MEEFCIELRGEQRRDGSVMVRSPDLPLFNVVGSNDDDAFKLAMKILPDYLKANVPEFVDLRRVKSATEVVTRAEERLLPAHIIARMGSGSNSNDSSSSS